jgi:rubredoxin
MQNEPILNYDFPLDAVAAEGNWHQANRYSVWVGRQAKSDPPYEVIEHHPQGAVRLPLRPRLMRLIPAGTPFRVTHLFAPYRASDADMIYIRAAMEEGVYHTLLAATSNEVKQDHVVWFCPHCGAEMGRETFDPRRDGLIAFWPFMLEQLRAFNASPERRKCRACGKEHPECYGFDAKLDRPNEAAARAEW